METENLILESWQISGIMRFIPLLYRTLTNSKDGYGSPNKKEVIKMVEFLCKFDKRHWHDFLSEKFFIVVDKKGNPCCRTVKKFMIKQDDYLDDVRDVDEGNK